MIPSSVLHQRTFLHLHLLRARQNKHVANQDGQQDSLQGKRAASARAFYGFDADMDGAASDCDEHICAKTSPKLSLWSCAFAPLAIRTARSRLDSIILRPGHLDPVFVYFSGSSPAALLARLSILVGPILLMVVAL